MNDATASDGGAGAEPAGQGTPQLRTLLLTDLCDSTELVEKLGDSAAAELFRAHDKLVLDLQQHWRARLIDRSDGLLLLFERAIDGLGFALDYVRGLRDIGQLRKLDLKARAGLHVGEVLTWRNSDAAVRLGAKPLEVEGLAKPMAARLMSLARPGQILLSSVAEPLAHRAARELGQRGEQLLWKSHGRWLFKGVPVAQEVFEVGEVGIAPLRPPRNMPKAWRDVPLWRRPAALVAEAAVLAGLVVGVWFATRPQPAIAFNERDWVVLGDLRNMTGDPRLDDSLAQAFRISLEQSRYVNMVSDLKVRDTLAQMQRKPDTAVDRAIGAEIALRDGARALILPTVSEVGGRLRVSAEVVDPHSQATVHALSADGKGIASALASIDEVTAALRTQLGEALQNIEQTSLPLPNVATPSLEALKAYALGRAKAQVSDIEGAIPLYAQALKLDPGFAVARAELGVKQFSLGHSREGLDNIRQALAQADHRLSPRERLRYEGLMAQFGPVADLLRQERQSLELYPDDLTAQLAYASDLWGFANRYAEALPHARAATAPMSPVRPRAYRALGAILLGQEDLAGARKAFAASGPHGDADETGPWSVLQAERRWPEARAAFDASHRGDSGSARLGQAVFLTLWHADQGQWPQALEAAQRATRLSAAAPSITRQAVARVRLQAVRLLAGERPGAADWNALLAWIDQHQPTLSERYVVLPSDLRIEIAYLAALAGDAASARKALSAVRDPKLIAWNPSTTQMHAVAQAQIDVASGHPAPAITRLQALRTRADALLAVHATLQRAYAATGDAANAAAEAEWLARHRGRAFTERAGTDALDVVDLATSSRTPPALLVTPIRK